VTQQTPSPGHKIEAAILALAGARGTASSVSPEDVAKSLAPEAWRPLLGAVRRGAAGLAAAGRIDILRKGKPIDPAELRGVIRLRIRSTTGDVTEI
jgi:hypothetical protein